MFAGHSLQRGSFFGWVAGDVGAVGDEVLTPKTIRAWASAQGSTSVLRLPHAGFAGRARSLDTRYFLGCGGSWGLHVGGVRSYLQWAKILAYFRVADQLPCTFCFHCDPLCSLIAASLSWLLSLLLVFCLFRVVWGLMEGFSPQKLG